MADALQRQWLLLRLIPRAPRKVDGARLEAALREQGIEVTRRTIQRDLLDLEALFPIVCDDRSKPHGWSWARDADAVELPGMEPRTALAFKLAFDYLDRMLPRSAWDGLLPHIRRAEAVLAAEPTNLLGAWPSKVRVVPRGPPVIPPAITPGIVDAVHAALLEGRCLHVTYRRRGASDTKAYRVHPLGLVLRDAIVYLVCTKDGETLPIQFVLHRLVSAEVREEPALRPPGFDLDAYIRSGAFGFQLSEAPIALAVRFLAAVASRLVEAPLGPDQRITPLEDDHLLLEVTLPDTLELRCWLLGFGETAEVLGPPALRDVFARTTAAASALYGRATGHRTRSPSRGHRGA